MRPEPISRRTRWTGVRSVRTAPAQALVAITVALMLAGLAGLTACGTRHASAGGNVCLTTVHGVVPGPGVLATTWIPAGFHLSSGGQSASAWPSATYAAVSARPDPPRLELSVSLHPGPLSQGDMGGRTARSVVIEGHHALVGSGPPDPLFAAVYWKPASGYLIAAGGYKLPVRVVLRAASHVTFEPPGTISLPVVPGSIVTRKAAEAASRQSAGGLAHNASAKLSSWTEVATLLSAHTRPAAPAAPAPLRAAPWQAIWVVVAGQMTVIEAGTGRVVATMKGGAATNWFAALTDRDPAAANRCPGGSSARLPFRLLP